MLRARCAFRQPLTNLHRFSKAPLPSLIQLSTTSIPLTPQLSEHTHTEPKINNQSHDTLQTPAYDTPQTPEPYSISLEPFQDSINSPPNSRFLTAAFLGPPNSGKSTLMNRLIGSRISGVSRKRNFTRKRMVGAMTADESQVIFYDTPGIVGKGVKRSKGWAMDGYGVLGEVDVGVVVVDGARKGLDELGGFVGDIVKIWRGHGGEGGLALVINKVDIVKPKGRLLEMVDFLKEGVDGFDEIFKDVFMVSGISGRGVEDVKRFLLASAKKGEWVVEEGTTSCEDPVDQVEELLREKIFHRLHQEVPYRMELENVEWKWLGDGKGVLCKEVLRTHSRHLIPVIVGTRGETIGWIAEQASKTASETLGYDVHICLKVVHAKYSSVAS